MADIRQEQIFEDIRAERVRQEQLHGEHNELDPLDWQYIGIIVEELGEASQALQYAKKSLNEVEPEEMLAILESYREELIHTTASGVMALERVGNLIEAIALNL